MGQQQPDKKRETGQPKRRSRRWRRRCLTLLFALFLLLALLLLFRNTLVRRALPLVTRSFLGIELHAERTDISLVGRVTVKGVQGNGDNAQGPIREFACRGLELRFTWTKLLRGQLEGLDSLAIDGLVMALELPVTPTDEPQEKEALSLVWPPVLPEIKATVERLSIRRGEDHIQIEQLGLDATTHPSKGSLVSLGTWIAWTVGDRVGKELLELDFSYAAGTISEVKVAAGRDLTGRGEVDLRRLKGEASLELDAGTLQVTFSRWRAMGRGEVNDLEALARYLPKTVPALAGAFAFSFQTLGSLVDPTVKVTLEAKDLNVADVPLGSLTGTVQASREALWVDHLSLVSRGPAPFDLALHGEIQLPNGYLRDFTVTGYADDWTALFPGLGPDLVTQLPPGRVSFRTQARGTYRWPDVDLAIHWDAEAQGAESAHSLVLSKAGDQLSLEVNDLPLGNGRLVLALAGNLTESLASGAFSVDRIAYTLPDAKWLSEAPSRFSYDLTASHFALQPPLALSDGQGEVRLGLLPDLEGERPGHLAELALKYPGDLRDAVPPLPFSLQDLQFLFRGRCRILGQNDAGPFFPETLEMTLRTGAVDLPQPASFTLSSVELQAQMRQVAADPEVDVSLAVPEFKLRDPNVAGFLAAPVEGRVAIAANYRDGRIDLSRAECALEALQLHASGTARLQPPLADLFARPQVPLLEALDLSLSGDVNDLALLTKLTTLPHRLSGRVTLEGRVAGSSRDPQLSATLGLEDVTARIEGLPPLSGLNAALRLAEDTLTLDSFATELGGAPLRVTGQIRSLTQTPRVDVALSGKDLLLARTDSLKIRSDTELALQGDLSALKASGTIRITEGRMLQTGSLNVGSLLNRASSVLDKSGRSAQTLQQSSSLQLFSLKEAPLKDLELMLDVTAPKGIDVKGEAFKGRVRPELRLLGTGETPFLVGAVYLDDFLFQLPVTDIKTESSVITFYEKRPLFPELSVLGTCRVRGYDVTVSITGPFNEPLVELNSNPPLPAAQLLLLVTTGKMPDSVDPEAQQKAAFAVAQYFALHLLNRLFGKQDIDDDSTSILDRFEYESGQDVSYSGNDTWEARFRLREDLLSGDDDLYLVGQRDEFDGYNIGLRLVVQD